MLTVLCLEASLLVAPLHLADAPPPLRSARNVTIYHAGSTSAPYPVTRSRDEALAIAADLAARLRGGVDFASLARERSESPNAATGAVLGTFVPGVLADPLEEFLFSAEVGAISGPIESGGAFHVLQRLETRAAVRQILARGAELDRAAHSAARERAVGWLARLERGADFRELAREVSEDEDSAKRGGDFAVYERGTRDTLLKAAAFDLDPGEVAGPIASPLGWHLLQRAPLDELDPSLAESNFVRVRAILVRHGEARSAPEGARSKPQALALAAELVGRLDRGEDMIALAREHDEDDGGRERAGDLGWIHRGTPGLSRAIASTFVLRVGARTLPLETSFGYVILQRER